MLKSVEYLKGLFFHAQFSFDLSAQPCTADSVIRTFLRGQAEKEFKVEVEIIGRVRHKNLVRLLGYCVEGAYRYHEFIASHATQYVVICFKHQELSCFPLLICTFT